jgi:hypothetical protein
VQEILKNSGKEAYTLRFATEQQAQGWQKAFELIAKVSSCISIAVAFAPDRVLTMRCSVHCWSSKRLKRLGGSDL